MLRAIFSDRAMFPPSPLKLSPKCENRMAPYQILMPLTLLPKKGTLKLVTGSPAIDNNVLAVMLARWLDARFMHVKQR